jgi:hypothetical protein
LKYANSLQLNRRFKMNNTYHNILQYGCISSSPPHGNESVIVKACFSLI